MKCEHSVLYVEAVNSELVSLRTLFGGGEIKKLFTFRAVFFRVNHVGVMRTKGLMDHLHE